MDRDLIGYGANPPDPKWPGGARLALNFVLNYEEGSEPSVPDGDPASEWGLTENGMLNPGVKGRDLAAEGMFAYGSRVAFWRIMRLFAERSLPLTVFGCALALERHPPAAAAIRAAGHDICCHGWRWEKHFELSEVQESERIRRAVASLQQTMGERPLGWYCRYGPSLNTRKLLVEEGGFLYDSDAYDDELPYWTTDQRLEIRSRHLRHRRRLLHLLPRRLRLPVSRGRHPAADDVGRPAYAHHRPPRPRRRAGAVA
jgi:peptidoglycan/xylan/chitin deacetylase (PgdA/CDA1 family)